MTKMISLYSTRWFRMLLASFLLFGTTFAWLMPLALAAGKTTVTIHYHPAPNDTRAWNLWLWTDGVEGKAYPFNNSDDFGPFGVYSFDGDYDQVGLIIRTDDWEKDTEGDRFVPIENGLGEIWLIGGDTKVYLSPPDVPKAAVIGKPGEVNVKINYFRPQGDYQNWYLAISTLKQATQYVPFGNPGTQGAAAEVTLKNMEGDHNLTYSVIHVNDPANIGKLPLSKLDYQQEGITHTTGSWEKLNAHEAWFIQGDQRMYTSAQSIPPFGRLVQAEWIETNQIRILSNGLKPKNEQTSDPIVTVGGVEFPIAAMTTKVNPSNDAPAEWIITLAQAPGLQQVTTVRVEGYGELPVRTSALHRSSSFSNSSNGSADDWGTTVSGGNTNFKLWAPTASLVDLITYTRGDDQSGVVTPMRTTNQSAWTVALTGDLSGTFYAYRVTVSGKSFVITDPFARLTNAYGDKSVVTDPTKQLDIAASGTESNKASNPDYVLHTTISRFIQDPNILRGFDAVVITDLVNRYNIMTPDASGFTNPYEPSLVSNELVSVLNQAKSNGVEVWVELPFSTIKQAAKFNLEHLVPHLVSSPSIALNWQQPIVKQWLQSTLRTWLDTYQLDGLAITGADLADAELFAWLQEEASTIKDGALVKNALPTEKKPDLRTISSDTGASMSTFAQIVLFVIFGGLLYGVVWFTLRVVGEGHNPLDKKVVPLKQEPMNRKTH